MDDLRGKLESKFVFEIILGIMALGVVGCAYYFIVCPPLWLWPSNGAHQNSEIVKITVFALGGLGAIYGLIISNRRANNAHEQLFNERLGRGVELLAHEKMTMRVAGVRVLDDLTKSSSREQITLIVQLMHDFVQQAQPEYNSGHLYKSHFSLNLSTGTG